uniref:HD domain-containing protein n=1 Tax=Globodera pallida TaxID=36090 RepID=A0A183CF95_GLOPA
MGFKRQWVCWSCPMDQQFQISDLVYGTVDIFYPINLIIDTPEFQRLRRVSQLGSSSWVYPSADHSRFSHSLGVYHLARQMVTHLAAIQPDLCITPNDQLCVCIAALIHDLGHGPFSHMFGSKFLKQMGVTDFEHEEMSRRIFKFMLTKNDGGLKGKLDEFLEETDYEFIDELIQPPKDLLSNAQWTLKGRAREKSVLYQIVSEPTAGFDVDKIDYLLRDAKLSNVSISLSLRPDRVFESRKLMHECVYGHKTAIAVDIMYVKALVSADPYLEFAGQNGKKYKMSNAHEDPQAFCRLDNNVTALIRYLDDPRLDDAKRVLDAIDSRELPKCVKKMHLNVLCGTDYDEIQKRIAFDLAKYSDDLQIIVKVQSFDYGKGVHRSPLKALCLFENKNPYEIMDGSADKTVDTSSPTPGGTLIAFFFVDYKDTDKKAFAEKALQKLIENHPNYFHRSGMGGGTKRLKSPTEEEWQFVSPPRKQLREENEICNP